MILFYRGQGNLIYVIESEKALHAGDHQKLTWLFRNAVRIDEPVLQGYFIGPRREMITPWSTNAVEITRNMGIDGIIRMEEFIKAESHETWHDRMLQAVYTNPGQDVFRIDRQPEPVKNIEDIAAYNQEEGLSLSREEITYLENLSKKLGRPLTDCEVFGFSQVNSEHCRHKIFNGRFILNGKEMHETLFQLIKKTSKIHQGQIVSAYKDNCAFINGPRINQFAPESQNKPDFFNLKPIQSVISLKAETHNFPTTVEPFNGAATGTGGEIRDRMAGGKAGIPLAGTAVYMTSYPRTIAGRIFEKYTHARPWLYQNPLEILIKASNGASDFGNKFGQPLICGSLLTFEHIENDEFYGYDKVIMLAGGVGYARLKDSNKEKPSRDDIIIVMGGDNYRIGMGGGTVSSVATGEYNNAIELNAVQRSNPEMQKRVANVIRAMSESDVNPVVSIHDHGAGGHLNCLSELVEETGGIIEIRKLPVGDPTLSVKEIAGNESQERMGLIVHPGDIQLITDIAQRERAPLYQVGHITGDHRLTFSDEKNQKAPIDLQLSDFFGNPPVSIMADKDEKIVFKEPVYQKDQISTYITEILQLESVACKDWLTNKVDRSVTGRIAMQQATGSLQLPLNNCAIVALDYTSFKGIATSLGHAPVAALNDPAKGSRLAIAEALTNLVFAPLEYGLKGVSLSANWMWPSKNPGEDVRLYQAVKAASDFAIQLSINIPTGKDSLSMTQKYPDGSKVKAPGTVIISTVAQVNDFRLAVTPDLKPVAESTLLYIHFGSKPFGLGGSSFSQLSGFIGGETPDIIHPEYFIKTFGAVQHLVSEKWILAGHDISSGGLITSLLEMCFASPGIGLHLQFDPLKENDTVKVLFNENPGILIQVAELVKVTQYLEKSGVEYALLGKTCRGTKIFMQHNDWQAELDIPSLRDKWFYTSYRMDICQSGEKQAYERFENYKNHVLQYEFGSFDGKFSSYQIQPVRISPTGLKAAIIREKGVNGDREMAFSMHLAGFDVKDVHMTDLISGRETLEDIHFIVFVGGFSNSDVLGSAKGWAGAFLFNPAAARALENFYARHDTISLGICNGCQLMIELGLVNPIHQHKPRMEHNQSHKFESGFVNVTIQPNQSIMLETLAGKTLGVWVAHGEGKFVLPYAEDQYHIPVKYTFSTYPANPNGSDFDTAAICSSDGRHLAMMPHIERSVLPWQWPYYHPERKNDETTPWIEAFVNARKWVEKVVKK